MKLSLLALCLSTAALAASHPAYEVYIAGPPQCNRGYAYCGWYLKNNLGKPNTHIQQRKAKYQLLTGTKALTISLTTTIKPSTIAKTPITRTM